MKSPTSPTKRVIRRRADRGILLEEMRRLMQVYGSIKCLRKRAQKPGAAAKSAKVDSVKRKFYRWFPDLDERFVKDANGFHVPKFGHDAEMKYREEMRMKDGEILAKKRVGGRKKGYTNGGITGTMTMPIVRAVSRDGEKQAAIVAPTPTTNLNGYPMTSVSIGSPEIMTPGSALLPCPDYEVETGIRLELDREFDNDRMASASIIEDTEPLDSSFIAERGIFDDVEKNFYNDPQPEQDCPSLELSSCSSPRSCSEEQGLISSGEERNNLPSINININDALGKSIEECCEDMLGSYGNDGIMDGYLFDVISS